MFLYFSQELSEYLPHWAINEDKDKKLTILQWTTAYQRWMVAAAVTNQLTFQSAFAHQTVVLTVGAKAFCITCCLSASFLCAHTLCPQAGRSGRGQWLMIIYDRMARKEWEQRSQVIDYRVAVLFVAP